MVWEIIINIEYDKKIFKKIKCCPFYVFIARAAIGYYSSLHQWENTIDYLSVYSLEYQCTDGS